MNSLKLAICGVIATCVSATVQYERGLTQHFINFLDYTKNYYPYEFNRTDFFGGAFGGKEDDNDTITRAPVIFIHGAAD